ncbi:MAG: DUF3100 domain-containing protein [Lachnospiraceae bacterium]|jgi:hypothetical protein|nr:DUF3100 domain-containing protein [Lachnospiraceae bacterium]NBJ82668.1 DUF3100 domain-containing protein [bacterium 1XD42-76]NBK05961.1 DUF3100 domain-containing protein [bacterium 1XD42-94]
MNEHLKDWRIHALAFVLTLIAEFIGTQKFAFGPLAFSLIPMLYVLIFGAILGGIKVLPHDMMEEASPYIGISVMMLTAKIAMSVGPNLEAVINAGPALIFQEFGNLGTAFLALPIAIGVFHMGRAAVGCCFSISREGSLAIIADKYGLDSEEGIGVMGGYIVGTVLGTLFYGILVSFLTSLNVFHPYSLGMACGTGSASMMSASLAAVVSAYPDMEAQITAYAATSNLLSSVDGLYMSLFIALPFCNWLYKVMTKNSRHYKDGVPIPKAAKNANK